MQLKFLYKGKFQLMQVRGGQKSQIWVKFSMPLKFLNEGKFQLLQGPVVKKSHIWVKFSTRLKFIYMGKFQLLQVRGGQKISYLSQIFNPTKIS